METKAEEKELILDKPPWNKGLTKETDPRVKVTKGNSGMRKDFPLRFWSKVDKDVPNGCWLWTGCKTRAGYGQIRISYDVARSKAVYAHILSWEMVNGPVPKGMGICHSCDNPSCINPNHLFLGTQSDNINDSVEKGRFNRPFGEKHPKAKLTEKDVIEIKSALENKYYGYLRDLAEKYDVSRSTILSIHYHRNWKYLLPKERELCLLK